MVQLTSNEPPTISFITSNKNKLILSINGYTYQQNKCTSKVCWADVHLDSHDQFIIFTEPAHTHISVPEQVAIRKLMTNVKARVNSDTTSIGQIYSEELAKTKLALILITLFNIS